MFVNQAVSSYNLGLEYGAECFMYGLGQGTTIVATTGVSAYGPQAMSNGFNAAKNSIGNAMNKLSTTSSNPLANIKYTDKVLRQTTLNDFHGFPECADAFGGDGVITSITGGDGIIRTQVEIAGGYKNSNGVFQYIIEPDGVTCNHRLFVPKE